ncbi:DEAD/DEAH box helicase family protein [Gloeocapsa sp. PCC 73106]|uniref:DEAD/DEAH box helicase family protein n=1 Tax=Gloeocapsa sp. PCC 73106 TaxID=102232 RepID=UPI0002ABC52D|nr:DEAD/DEAH box helicase family protein [Gloeocapsa sp. PCC 73106]ELR99441.1 DNA/RNA helicase, superfamily II [Gloeocapsa sp. PCC 73106]
MTRLPKLQYHRGTLILHPPPQGKAWLDYATWDDRIEKFRIPGIYYRPLIEALKQTQTQFIDEACDFSNLELSPKIEITPYPHQTEALNTWKQKGKKGVIVLPTGAGKTYVAQLAMETTPNSTLIIVPTLDLMHQWYTKIIGMYPNVEVGLLGGGSRDRTSILIATYHSAAIHSESLGNRYGFLIFDECHHLPTDFFRVIAENSIAPYRLGLTATPERSDGNHRDLDTLIGPIIYRKSVDQLAATALSQYQTKQIRVKLSQQERQKYEQALKIRNDFLRSSNISLSSLNGWQLFVKASASSSAGRRAMLAHREAKEITAATSAKLNMLTDLILQHYPESILIFTNDNATVYRISREFLIPSITHQTPVKERHEILEGFRSGKYKTLVTSHVLNEGVDVPEVKVAIILSGTSSAREYIQRLGRILRKSAESKLAILYEIIAENTTEEAVSQRRRGEDTPASIYQIQPRSNLKAAEKQDTWGE